MYMRMYIINTALVYMYMDRFTDSLFYVRAFHSNRCSFVGGYQHLIHCAKAFRQQWLFQALFSNYLYHSVPCILCRYIDRVSFNRCS